MRNPALRHAMLAALFAALTAVAAQIAVPMPPSPVPITMQVLAVLLAGGLLGARWGAVAMLIYVLLGVVGLPVFAGGKAGLGVVIGPTGGYLLSYPVAALLVGWLAPAQRAPGGLRTTLAMAAGLAAIYAGGAGWAIALGGKTYGAVMSGWVLPFIPFDLLKLFVAQLIATEVNRALQKGAQLAVTGLR